MLAIIDNLPEPMRADLITDYKHDPIFAERMAMRYWGSPKDKQKKILDFHKEGGIKAAHAVTDHYMNKYMKPVEGLDEAIKEMEKQKNA